jgi:hypothetical protein
MQHVLPAARSLRTVYALWSDRLWFAVAILSCLILAGELAGRMLATSAPLYHGGFGL